MSRWRNTKAGGNDPLLFVESIPVAETRSYVKRVMLYHWLYRRRFGQDAHSLDEISAGALADLSSAAERDRGRSAHPVPMA